MNNNKLIIASAGSGKTTLLVNEALNSKSDKILITTYTQANEEEIRKKFINKNKCIPENVTVQTWFAFLLQHGVRPYQGKLFLQDIRGLILESGQSTRGIAEKNTEKFYFTKNHKIYSDKLSKFILECNKLNDGAVIDRLSRIYSHIYIDEVQDLAGYDLDLLSLLFDSTSNTFLVGDPRQGTYSTNNSSKNKKYRKSKIVSFFEEIPTNLEVDDTSLNINYRCISKICDLSNQLYPDLQKTKSGNSKVTGHDGVFFVRKIDIEKYIEKYNPIQLRDSIKTKIIKENQPTVNFGKSKGLEYERVLIYPTNPFISWLKNNNSELKPTSRSKFYVAITRAFYSVGIVYDYNDEELIDRIEYWTPDN